MKTFDVGNFVFGTVRDHIINKNEAYVGRITEDYGDASYTVELGEGFSVYVELYNDDTMEHATKLHKLLAGDDDV